MFGCFKAASHAALLVRRVGTAKTPSPYCTCHICHCRSVSNT